MRPFGVTRQFAILGDQFVDGRYGAMHLGVLKFELEGIPIVLEMNDVDLTKIRGDISSGGLVA